MTTVAPSITGALRLDGLYLGVDPAIPGVVYANRPSAGGWETAVISEHDNKIDCDVYYGDADVRLCVTPDGDLETRPGSAAPGAWETFSIAEQLTGVLLIHAVRDDVLVAVFEVELKE
jgi:hypothetical protein